MRKKFGRVLSSVMIAAMAVTSVPAVPAVYAGELEGDSAVAGMAVTLNNYYAGSETPDEAIMDYLVPLVQSSSEASDEGKETAKSTAEGTVMTVMDATVADADLEDAVLGVISAAGYLNVRETPSTDGKLVGRLYSNCQVAISDTVSNSEGEWYSITCGDVEGYVSAAYVLTGDAAEEAESNIKNRYALVTAESLDVLDTASSEAKVVDTIYAGEEYQITEEHGSFVKLYLGENRGVGYASKDGISIKTQFTEALKIDDEYISEQLEDLISEVSYSRNLYETRMSSNDYYDAYSAISYASELLGYYINTAENYGLTELASDAEAEKEEADKKAEEAYELAKESGYFDSIAAQAASAAETSAAQTDTESTEAYVESTEISSESRAEDYATVEIPTAATVTGIEAYYQGGSKTVGDIVYASDLYLQVTYSDGTVKNVYEGWYSPEVGMTLKNEGNNVITMYYDSYVSSFNLWASAAPTVPETAVPETAVPETAVPETAVPETAVPETAVPETAVPETAVPETAVPETAVPETAAPETQAPTTEATTAATEPQTQPTTANTASADALRNQVVSYATSWVGRCNYVWGGTNLVDGGGVDCSGFTMIVYSTVGIGLDHYSGSQINSGYAVSDPLPGDLVAFQGHVGIYIGNGMMVHAANESLGIIISAVSSCSKPFVGYRRLIG